MRYLKNILVDEWFGKKLDKTEGKLVFKNGILDLETEQFQLGFKSEDYISLTLNYDYGRNDFDEEKMGILRGHLKKILNNDEEHLEYYLCCIGHAFTGASNKVKGLYLLMDGTGNCRGDNGKSVFFEILRAVFPQLVGKTDYDLLELGTPKIHKKLKELDRKRLVFIDEGGSGLLNVKLAKEIANGEEHENEIMYGTAELLKIDWMLFICSNELPKIHKKEEAFYNRLKQLQFIRTLIKLGNERLRMRII